MAQHSMQDPTPCHLGESVVRLSADKVCLSADVLWALYLLIKSVSLSLSLSS